MRMAATSSIPVTTTGVVGSSYTVPRCSPGVNAVDRVGSPWYRHCVGCRPAGRGGRQPDRPEGTASAVLLRTGEITAGAEHARKRRISARDEKELAKGPARLATALDVDRALDGTDVCAVPAGPLSVPAGIAAPSDQVRTGPRTGVGGDGATHPWRFWIEDDPTVSPYRAHSPRRRSGRGT
ncbi:hypothetical protein GUY61_30540 [Streptomyces sp. GC420]|nr:hypothetical protein [Streptomyces sp. GC420]